MTVKTIRMPKTTLDKWLAALRSGEYAQANSWLEYKGGYCCLGVLQCVVDGAVEKVENEDEARKYACPIGHPLSLPTEKWMSKNGIESRWGQSESFCTMMNPVVYKEPEDELYCTYPMAAELNDERQLSFKKIADLVEACTETY